MSTTENTTTYDHREAHLKMRVAAALERKARLWPELGAKIAALNPEHRNGEKVNDLTLSAIREEAELDLWIRVGMIAEREPCTHAEALQVAIDSELQAILSQGADDTWSGRGNDARRAQFDARRDWVQTQRLVS